MAVRTGGRELSSLPTYVSTRQQEGLEADKYVTWPTAPVDNDPSW